MTGIEKIGLVFLITCAPYMNDANGLLFTVFALIGALLFVVPQGKT